MTLKSSDLKNTVVNFILFFYFVKVIEEHKKWRKAQFFVIIKILNGENDY